MQQLIEQFKQGEDVAAQIIEQSLEATPYIEQLLQATNTALVERTLQQIILHLPFYVGLVLHDELAKLAQHEGVIGELAEQALHTMAP